MDVFINNDSVNGQDNTASVVDARNTRMEQWRNDTNGGTPVPVPQRPRTMSWNQTKDSTVREAAVNLAEGEPMNAVRDFLLPYIVLPPIVSVLSYVQLD